MAEVHFMEMPPTDDPVSCARKAHLRGDFDEAEKLYEQLLRSDASRVELWYEIGRVQQSHRKHDSAIDSFQRAIGLDARFAEAYGRLGISLIERGKRKAAIEAYKKALELRPIDADSHYHLAKALAQEAEFEPAIHHVRLAIHNNPRHVEAHTNLGVYLARQGKRDEAIDSFRQALVLRPEHIQAWNNLGVAFAEQGKGIDSIECYRKALEIEPNYLEAMFNLAVALAEQKQFGEAIIAYERLLQKAPNHVAALNNLGVVYTDVGHLAEAVTLLQQAVRLQRNSADTYNNLGLALMMYGRFAEAEIAYQEALRLNPGHAEAHNDLGTNHAMRGQPQEALACYAHALRLRPNYPEAHWHRALTLLQIGDFDHGWPEYEWRWKRKRSQPHRHKIPLWDGTPYPGRTLLLHGEQGIGDMIQFIRYVPLVKERGGRIILECPPELMGLLSTCRGIDQLVPANSLPVSADLQAPLLSLPLLFRTTQANLPVTIPYLAADAVRVNYWQEHVVADKKLKIGVFWQGNPKHRWDRFRSVPAVHFARLGTHKGVQVYSLQKGPGMEQVQTLNGRFPVVDLGSQFEDPGGSFTDAAAVLAHLDLVIGCDSALAHLAGALGRPVWLLLSEVSDWRWMRERKDTPWYPTMRLFRQRALNDWAEVFRRVSKALRRLVAEKVRN